jgi:hypothetical protein
MSPMLAQYKILSGREEPPTQPSQFRICQLHLNHLQMTKMGGEKQYCHPASTGDSVLFPVILAAGIVWRIRVYPGITEHTTISTYMSNGETLQVTLEQVTNALRNAVGAISKDALGILRAKIGTQSIRLELAMAMYLGKCPVYTIMLIGWWPSNAFRWYICKQVIEFSHNVLQKMPNYQNYWHVPNFEHQIPENDTRQRNDPNNAETRQNIGGDASRHVGLPVFSQFN